MERILSLVWFQVFPAHFGGQKGIVEFYKVLSLHYPVDCLCALTNSRLQSGNLQVLPQLPNGKWQFLNPLVWQKIVRQFRQQQYRYLLIEFPYYGFIGYLLKKKGVVYILHTHNIESQRFRKLGKWWWPVLHIYERWSLQQAHLVLFKTTTDKQYALKHFALKEEKTYVLPYGIEHTSPLDKKSCRLFLEQTYNIKADEIILLFAGTLDYLPNAEAVEAIYLHIAPLLCQNSSQPFRIIICGRNKEAAFAYLKKYQHANVIQAGFTEEIDYYITGADVFINPVQKVFGVQTKIVDAIAKELNVAAFEEAGTGLPSYLLNKKLFLARGNQWGDFVQKIQEAFGAPQPTPQRFYEEFYWQKIVSNFVERLMCLRS